MTGVTEAEALSEEDLVATQVVVRFPHMKTRIEDVDAVIRGIARQTSSRGQFKLVV